MGFWSRLFGRNKSEPVATAPLEVAPEVPAVKVTPQPEPVPHTPSIAEVEAEVEALLRDLFPGAVEKIEVTQAEADAEKARKRSEAAKKAAATRAAKKAAGYNPKAVDGDGDGMVQDGTIWERPAPKKKSTPKKK